MAAEWIQVRVQRRTHEQLAAVRASLQRAAEQGKLALDLDSQGRVSLDQVISLLIRDRERHARRRRKAAATRKVRRCAAGPDRETSP